MGALVIKKIVLRNSFGTDHCGEFVYLSGVLCIIGLSSGLLQGLRSVGSSAVQ